MSSSNINVTPFSPANSVKPTVTSSGGTFAGWMAGPSPEPASAKVPVEVLPRPLPGDSFSAPPAPAIGGIIDHVGPVTGNVAPGSTTDDPMPTISGSGAQPGDRITLSDNGMFIGAAIVDKDGNWSVTPFTPLGNGPHTFTATETNFSTGMTSSPSAPVSIVIDTPTMPGKPETPPAPIIGGAFDAVGAIQGNIANGGQTDDTQPVFFGAGQAGDLVRLYDGSNLIGSAIADTNGRWSIKPAAPLGQGLHSIHATETNAAGKVSASSPDYVVNVTISAGASQTPIITSVYDHVGSHTGNIAPGGQTDDAQPTIGGMGHAGDVITVTDFGRVIGSATVDKSGNWSFTPATPLANGNHDITAVASSAGQSASAPSAHVMFTVQPDEPTAPVTPPAPIIGGAFDAVGAIQGNIANGGQTDDTRPAFFGAAQPGDMVRLYDGNTLIGSAIAGPDGRWSIKPAAPLGEGSHSIHATETNAAGNVSASSPDYVVNVTIDASPSQTPIIMSVYDHVGSHTGNIAPGGQTDDAQPTISGTGHAGDVITVLDFGMAIGSAIVDSDGHWSFTPARALANGDHYIVAVASSAGHPASAPSAHVAFTVQPDAPIAAPTIDFLIDAVGPVQGNVYNGGTGDDSNATLKGHSTPGEAISCYVNGMFFKTVLAESDGTYTIHLENLDPGNLSITTRSVNGAYSVPFVYHLQSSATDVPTIDYLVDAVGAVQGNVSSGGVTDDVNGVLKGHSQAGDLVKIYDGVTLLGVAMVSKTGDWSFQLDNMSSGTHSIHAVSSRDGADSATFAVTFGTPAAGAPTIDAIVDHTGPVTGNIAPGRATDDNRPTLSGKGVHAGDIVTVSDHGASIGSATVDANGNWSFTPANPLADGSHSFTATGTNPSTGVTGPASIAVSISVDTTAPSAPHLTQVVDHMGSVQGAIAAGSTTDDYQAEFRGDGVAPGDIVKAFNNGTLFGSTVADADGNWSFGPALPMANGAHDITFTATKSSTGAVSAVSDAFHYTIDATQPFVPGHIEAVPVMLNVDPQAYFAKASAHIAGGGGIDTIALTGDHQILDLTSLTGKTAAAKISGVEVFDLGGHHNTLKVSLLDVLNLGEKDLFAHDGKQQIAVKGTAGDTVDLSNAHVAGAVDGQWAQHGTAQVGGVTYAVFEHSGAHVELLVQQGVATNVHQ